MNRRPLSELGPGDVYAIRELAGRRANPRRGERGGLTPAELRALGALSHGLTIKEAAVVLGYSSDGVDSQLANARRVLAAKTNAQAVAHALRQGLIT